MISSHHNIGPGGGTRSEEFFTIKYHIIRTRRVYIERRKEKRRKEKRIPKFYCVSQSSLLCLFTIHTTTNNHRSRLSRATVREGGREREQKRKKENEGKKGEKHYQWTI